MSLVRWTRLLAVAFAAIAAAIYGPALSGPFVFDDSNIQDNPLLHVSRLPEIADLLSAEGVPRKVGMATFSLNHYFGGLDPFGYHLVNVALHGLNGVLLFALAVRLLARLSEDRDPRRTVWTAALGAGLWLVHPVQTQAVSYVWQRFTVLAASFFLLSLLCYVEGRSRNSGARWLYAASAAFGLLALGSKENAATLPCFVGLVEVVFFQKRPFAIGRRKLVFLLLLAGAFAMTAWLYLGPRFLSLMEADYARRGFTPTQRLLTESRVVVHYVTLLVLPHPSRLNVDYDFPLSLSPWRPPTTASCLGLVLGSLVFAVIRLGRNRATSFAVLWFLGNLAIESTVVPLDLAYEHRLYLPSMALLFLLADALVATPFARKVKWTLVAILLSTFAFWSFERNRLWADPVLLWSDNAAKSPSKARVHGNLGKAYADRGDFLSAERSFQRALQIDPDLVGAYNNLAVLYLDHLDRTEEAVPLLDEALKRKPDDLDAHVNLGVAFLRLGDLPRAERHFQTALRHDHGRTAQNFLNLALVHASRGDRERAREVLRRALAYWPGDPRLRTLLAEVGGDPR